MDLAGLDRHRKLGSVAEAEAEDVSQGAIATKVCNDTSRGPVPDFGQ